MRVFFLYISIKFSLIIYDLYTIFKMNMKKRKI